MIMVKNRAVIIPVIEYRIIMATAVLGDGPNGFELWLLLFDPSLLPPPPPVPFTAEDEATALMEAYICPSGFVFGELTLSSNCVVSARLLVVYIHENDPVK